MYAHTHLSFLLVDDAKLVAHVHCVLVELLYPFFSLWGCDSDHLVHVDLLTIQPGDELHAVCVHSCRHKI